jgi:hypothetical protein
MLAHELPTKERENRMMSYILVRHKVEDYAKWKPFFDGHRSTRQASGSTSEMLLRNAHDPHELLILLGWDTLEHAQQFVQSEDLRQVMQRAGVVDQPDIYFLEKVDGAPA